MMFPSRRLLITVVGLGLIWVPAGTLRAQQSSTPPAADPQAAAPEGAPGQATDPLNRQLSDKARYKAQHELRQELKGPYKTWLDQEVPYIISDDERKSFLSLANDEERRVG